MEGVELVEDDHSWCSDDDTRRRKYHLESTTSKKNRGLTTTDDGWIDSMVEVARACNKLFKKQTCGICHMYAEKQVEFETRQENKFKTILPSPVQRAWIRAGLHHTTSNSLEVDMYRQFLFDEESVCQRGDGFDGACEESNFHERTVTHASKDSDYEEVSIISHGTN